MQQRRHQQSPLPHVLLLERQQRMRICSIHPLLKILALATLARASEQQTEMQHHRTPGQRPGQDMTWI